MGIRVLALVTEAFGGHGGIALYNRDMLTALSEHPDVDEVVAIPRLLPETPVGYPDKITYLTNGLEGKLNYIRAVLSALKERPKFDLILCAHINLLPISQLAAVKTGATQILGIYGIDAWQPTTSRLTNYLTRRLRHFYAISEITKRRFLTWSALAEEAGFLLPNAIHTQWYGLAEKNHELIQRYGLSGKKILMTLGRFSAIERYKGVDEILGVLPELIQIDETVHYLVVGDGDDRQRLQEKADALGLSDNVTFTGRIDESQKADVFRLADAYVMPSSGEGFGFVFLEAMACGIPVVASETDGGREAIRDGQLGRLVNPKDAKGLKEAIIDAMKSPKAIPSELEYFEFPAFKKRVDDMITRIGIRQTV